MIICKEFHKLKIKIGKSIKNIIFDLTEQETLLRNKKENLNRCFGQIEKTICTYDDLIKKGNCPICNTQIDSHKFIERKRQAESEKLDIENKISTIGMRINSLVKEISKEQEKNNKKNNYLHDYVKYLKESNEKCEEILILDNSIRTLLEDKASIVVEKEEKIKEPIKKIELDIEKNRELKEKYINYENTVQNNQWCKEQIEDKTKDIQKLELYLDDCEKKRDKNHLLLSSLFLKIEPLQNIVKEYDSSKKLCNSIKDEVSILLAKISSSDTTITHLTNDLDEKAKLMKQIKNYIEKQRSLRENLLWINDFFLPTLENIEKHIMEMIRHRFENQFRNLYSLLIDDPAFQISVNETFDPLLERDGVTQSYHQLSGGERTSIALAYRLALNKIVQEESKSNTTHLIILDEPTEGFSPEQKSKIRIILNEINCPQVIIVSHDSELEGLADHIYRVNNLSGKSTICIQ